MEEGRPLPQSVDAERIVLGGILVDPERIHGIAEHVVPDDFYRDAHGRLFELLLTMKDSARPTELHAVLERITAGGTPDDFGGLAYVSSLGDHIPSTENLEYYAKVVKEKAMLRRLIQGARDIQERAIGGADEIPDLMDFAEQTVFAVSQESGASDWRVLSTVVDKEFVRIEKLSERGDAITGVSTGFVDLDRILAGLQPSDLVVLAARPAMGKTALAMNIAQNAALLGAGVGVFSLEMSAEALATRMLCSQARVDANKVRTGFLSKDRDWPKLTRAAEELYHVPLFLDDTPAMSVTQIRSKARRLKAKHPSLRVIVVDYIGLMHGDPRINREQQVSTSSRGLKALAKELDITVVALSQLNRGVEARVDKRPLLSDLRESGAIEQDADVILFIYRDEYYNRDSPFPGQAEVIVAKQRNGPTGVVRLAFLGEYTRFENLARTIDHGGYG